MAGRFDYITEVNKADRYDHIEEVQKFNPYHDSRGRFSSSSGAISFTYAPGKSRAHDLAIQRERERVIGGAAGVKRIEDAEASMRGLLKDGAEVRLQGMDPDMAESTVAAVKNVLDRYPIARDGIAGIVTDGPDAEMFKDAQNCMGAFNNDTQKIHLNTEYYGNRAEFEKRYKASVDNKFHPEGTTLDSVVVHEMGHAIDRHVSIMTIGEFDVIWRGDRISSRKWNNDLKSAARRGEPITGKIMTENLSRYAGSKPAEYFAEGFSEAMTSPSPRKMATSILKHLDTYVKKAGGN